MSMLTDVIANNWIEALQSALAQPLQRWLTDHPLAGWLVVHPLWLLAVVVVVILLFAGLWSALARLTEGFWLTLVRLPFQLSVWVFTTLASGLTHQWARAAKSPPDPDRLSEIMLRLESLQTEQETLLKEMRQILAKSPTILDQDSGS
jgi:hypothetical protein